MASKLNCSAVASLELRYLVVLNSVDTIENKLDNLPIFMLADWAERIGKVYPQHQKK